MADEIDRAQEREQVDRDMALAAADRRRRIEESMRPYVPGQRLLCVDCDQEIDERRLAAMPRACRCIDCAQRHEQRLRHFR